MNKVMDTKLNEIINDILAKQKKGLPFIAASGLYMAGDNCNFFLPINQ